MTDISAMRVRTSKSLLLNITRLLKCSELLAGKRQYGPAVHMMMAAREECAKWVVLFCWEHLDNSTRGKIYNHIFKHELGSLFYYLTGRVQVAAIFAGMTKYLEGRDPEWDKSASMVATYLFDETENYDARRLSEQIKQFLYGEQREASKEQYAEHFRKMESDRTGSIYVDFDKQLCVTVSPKNFSHQNYIRYRKDVLLARYYIDRLRGRRRNRNALYRIDPKWRSEVRETVRGFAKHLKSRKDRENHS